MTAAGCSSCTRVRVTRPGFALTSYSTLGKDDSDGSQIQIRPRRKKLIMRLTRYRVLF